MTTILLTLLAGAVAGNLVPHLHRRVRKLDLRRRGNTLAGALGGGFGGSLAVALGLGPGSVGALAFAALGGAAAVAVIAWARNQMLR